jgi:hypothetical protein
VVSEVNGAWSPAVMVPGMAALGGGKAQVNSVSCASAGNCGAGREFTDTSGARQAFVVDEVNGHWQEAIEVPGTLMLNTGRPASVTSVSCTAPGNCGAGGSYMQDGLGQQAFVATEVNGTWRAAIAVPGSAALNQGGSTPDLAAVSCGAAGNCSAVSGYTDASRHHQAFVISAS